MPDRDYSHRDVIDKLGINEGHVVVFSGGRVGLDEELCRRVLERTGRELAQEDELVDIVLAMVESVAEAGAVFESWKVRLRPNGGIWLLSRKRGWPEYIDQNRLMEVGLAAGMVDNKICSVDERTSGMRSVFRKKDRPAEVG